MSVFKRLGNVARGKMMEIGRNLSGDGPDGDPDEVDPDAPPPRRVSEPVIPKAAAPPADAASRREMLVRMRDEGLLTPEEYADKLAALDAPPAPPAPRKRRL
ncbi:MAG: hypothetical protein H6737_10710 [Alphaproteobacteria bacterium]|nr:hypothetical protein [Alphaproteobacteria bacterium]